jgi:uncharacterized protein
MRTTVTLDEDVAAALAALEIEHGATLCTTDRDFARFPELRTVNPLDD